MLSFIEANVAHSLEPIHPPAEGQDPREQTVPGRPRENQEERRVASAVGAQLSEDTLCWSHGLGRSPGPREPTASMPRSASQLRYNSARVQMLAPIR